VIRQDAPDETDLLQLKPTPGGVDVFGELDIATGPLLAACIAEQLSDAHCRCVRLNLSEVHFIDCSGLGAVLRARAEAHARGKDVVIECAGGRVRQLLERTGTSRVLLEQ
jgi:anti-anti-sigma factor